LGGICSEIINNLNKAVLDENERLNRIKDYISCSGGVGEGVAEQNGNTRVAFAYDAEFEPKTVGNT
jgi:hypothetical protein